VFVYLNSDPDKVFANATLPNCKELFTGVVYCSLCVCIITSILAILQVYKMFTFGILFCSKESDKLSATNSEEDISII